jgi:elongation of very long chain fatty acids protein 4
MEAVRAPLEFAFESTIGYLADWADANAHSQTLNYPLMTQGRLILSFSLLYVLFVMVGMRVMKSREPMGLKALSMVHNVLLVVLSAYMCAGIGYEYVKEARRTGRWVCMPASDDPEAAQLTWYLWLFYVSKAYEFMDTAIMIGRKKFEQVTFLHVYHHSTILAYWFLILKTTPGGDGWLSAFLNSGVHVLMYSYYLLTSFGVSAPWKSWVTKAQMIQFVMFLVQSSYVTIIDCHHGTAQGTIGKALIFYAFSLLALFANFFYQTYIKKKKAAKSKKQ